MMSTLALSVLGTWSYAGFLAEPSPTPVPSPTPAPAPKLPPAPSAPIPLEPEQPLIPAEAPRQAYLCPPKAPAKRPPVSSSPILPSPTLYRLADASGQTWEHPDPAYLSGFVEDRNRRFASVSLAPPMAYYTYTYASPRPPRASRFARNRSWR
jgi:hypothetical protein